MKLLEAQPEVAPGAPPEPPREAPPEDVKPDPGTRTCKSAASRSSPARTGAWRADGRRTPGRAPRVPLLDDRPRPHGAARRGRRRRVVRGAARGPDRAAEPGRRRAGRADAAGGRAARYDRPARGRRRRRPRRRRRRARARARRCRRSRSRRTRPRRPRRRPRRRRLRPRRRRRRRPRRPRRRRPRRRPARDLDGSGTSTSTTPSTTDADRAGGHRASRERGGRLRPVPPRGRGRRARQGDRRRRLHVLVLRRRPGLDADRRRATSSTSARRAGIKAIDITTPTPGFKVEIYATDEATPPPSITDTRWAHITDKSDVGADGKTHIVLGAGSSKYQTLLLWITKPPTSGTRVRISELKVFG